MVTFYSEGPPGDPGIPLAAMAGVFEAAFAPHVDSFNKYTPRSVATRVLRGIPGSRVVQASHVGASMNTGLSAIGQLAVKPYVILLRMLEIPYGDLLVYKDANILKRPQLLAGASRIRAMAAWALTFAAPAHDVFIPFENTQLKLKHHCKSHAVRTMVPPAEWDAVFESPLHHSCQVIARRTPAAEAFLWAWLQACLRKDMLEQQPDPVMTRHPAFRWHTHEQCLFSIVASLQRNAYARQLWFCWKLTQDSAREIGGQGQLDQPCTAPSAQDMRSWLLINSSHHGYCLGVECPSLESDCPYSRAALYWFRRAPNTACSGPTCSTMISS